VALAPEMEGIGYFHLTPAKIGDASVIVSRTGYTGDLGYEIWVEADDAMRSGTVIFDVASPTGSSPSARTPFSSPGSRLV
jgi:aminomethyltransferase